MSVSEAMLGNTAAMGSMGEGGGIGSHGPRRSWLRAVRDDARVGRRVDQTIGYAIAAPLLLWSVAPLFGDFDPSVYDLRAWPLFIGMAALMAAAMRPNLFSPLTLTLVSLCLAVRALATGEAFRGPKRRRSILTGRPIRPRRRRPGPTKGKR